MKKEHGFYILLSLLILLGTIFFYGQKDKVWGTRFQRLDNLVLYDPHNKTSYTFSNKKSQQVFIQLSKSKDVSQGYRQTPPTVIKQETLIADEPKSDAAYGGDYGGTLQLYEQGGVTIEIPIPANHYAQIYLKTEYLITSSQIEEKQNGKWVVIGQVESRQEIASHNEAITWTEEEWEEQYPTDSDND